MLIYAPKNTIKSIKTLKNKNKTIVYIPTIHVSKPEFYKKIKKEVDSLRQNNFTIFYEEIGIDNKYYKKNIDNSLKEEFDILLRKYRKLMGNFFAGDLTDKSNHSLPKLLKKNKYVSQTKELLGIDTLNDINADITLNKLISVHEKKYGEIILNKCDYETKFYEKYKCKNLSKYKYYAIRYIRDSIAAQIVLDKNNPNSVLIYGRGHWYGIWPYFRDAGFVLVKK